MLDQILFDQSGTRVVEIVLFDQDSVVELLRCAADLTFGVPANYWRPPLPDEAVLETAEELYGPEEEWSDHDWVTVAVAISACLTNAKRHPTNELEVAAQIEDGDIFSLLLGARRQLRAGNYTLGLDRNDCWVELSVSSLKLVPTSACH